MANARRPIITLTRELGKLEQVTKKGRYHEDGVKKAGIHPSSQGLDVAMTNVRYFAARYQGREQ